MKNSLLHKIIAALISICMLMAMLLLSACASPSEEPEMAEGIVEYALALRAIDDIAVGEGLDADKIQVARVRTDSMPEGTYSAIEDIDGKYALSHISSGDFITAAKVSDTQPEILFDDVSREPDDLDQIDPYELGYVVITKYLSFAEGGDYAPAIKKAIEENPAKTIYFPDGDYVIKSPIVIPTDPSKSVSLRLSSHAVITAADWGEDKTEAMIQIGCEQADEPEALSEPLMGELDFSQERSISIIGGCLYGSKMASGIAVGGGKDTYIYNVSIKRVYNGIHIKRADNEFGATYVNVDNVNIVGMEASDSSGVLVEGSYNTFSNMRIASTNYGVLCTETGSNNSFRFIHPLVVGLNRPQSYTVGFWDKSVGNNFDACYSDQFSTGYRVEEISRSVFNGCLCYWYSERNNYHVGYESSGKLNSIIVSGKVLNKYNVATEAYIYVRAEGGQGVVLYPINSTESDMYSDMNEILGKYGYHKYEISNFSKKGRESRHNVKYWRTQDYLGFGPAAHSCYAGKRFAHSRDIGAYLRGESIIIDVEELSEKAQMNEYVMLGMRLYEGIKFKDFEDRFACDFMEEFGRIRQFSPDFVAVDGEGCRFAEKGMFVSNFILSEILDFD